MAGNVDDLDKPSQQRGKMGLRIHTNVASIRAQRALSAVSDNLASNFRRLATGLKISSAADDAAGLAISERLRSQVRSLMQARRNANDGVSLIQTAEGAMGEVNNILLRLRELSVQSANGSVSPQDRDTLNSEFKALVDEVNRIGESTEFNDVKLLSGTTKDLSLQVGVGLVKDVDTLIIALPVSMAAMLNLDVLDIGSSGDSVQAINALDTAIDHVSGMRGRLGATQNRLESVIANLGVQSENLANANSLIRDTDVAAETAELTRNSILQQATIGALSQANVAPQSALSLLG